MRYKHECKHCGKEFYSKKKNTKFCSAKCGNEHQNLIKILREDKKWNIM